MTSLCGKVILVTGASVGIGKAICEGLVKSGSTVIGVARNFDVLKSTSDDINLQGPGKMLPFKCDVTKEDEILLVFNEISSRFGSLYGCINNAGLAHQASLMDGETKQWKEMLDVNVMGLCICTREACKLMTSGGHVVHLNSLSGHRVTSPFYSATKFAVTALTEGLRRELRAKNSKIRVTSISPGVVETEFVKRMNGGSDEKARKLYESFECLQAEDIKDAVLFALQAPQRMEINDILIRPTDQKF